MNYWCKHDTFYEENTREGKTRAVHNYAEANNKHMYHDNKSKESTFILNLNFNNMYGYALSRPLPYREFEFVEYLSMITFDFIMNYDEESNISYKLMVDVDYPVYLQPLHKHLLCLPERRVMEAVIKLVCTFFD